MSGLKASFKNFMAPIKPLQAGMYHYISPQDDPRNYRLHLRIEEDGHGILILNGSTILHLNQTATEYAFYLIQNLVPNKVGHKMARRYHISPADAEEDYKKLSEQLQIMVNTPDLDPVTYLDFDRHRPFTGPISIPYRVDCAITYSLSQGNGSNEELYERVYRELETEEWYSIIDKAWKVGIPHIVFTGGEATLREDLPELIAHAENNGQITGLLTDGLRFQDKEYLHKLLYTGLDHLLIVIQPELEPSWKALANAIEEDIFVAVHLTLKSGELENTKLIIQKLHQYGVKAISLSTSSQDLKPELDQIRKLLSSLNIELVWNLPVPYSELNPVRLEIPNPAGLAGRAWLYIEPDGDILPAQGVPQKLGNFLTDEWENIRKNIPT